MEENKPTLTDVLGKLAESLEEKKQKEELEKNKKINLWIPFGAKVGKAKAKNNYIMVDRWHSNMTRTFERAQIKDGTIMVDDVPRIITPGDIMLYKGKTPTVTIADWSTTPISPVDHFTQSQVAGYGTKGWKLLYQRLKNSVIEDKKKMSGAVIWIIIAAVIAAGYFAFKGGLLG